METLEGGGRRIGRQMCTEPFKEFKLESTSSTWYLLCSEMYSGFTEKLPTYALDAGTEFQYFTILLDNVIIPEEVLGVILIVDMLSSRSLMIRPHYRLQSILKRDPAF